MLSHILFPHLLHPQVFHSKCWWPTGRHRWERLGNSSTSTIPPNLPIPVCVATSQSWTMDPGTECWGLHANTPFTRSKFVETGWRQHVIHRPCPSYNSLEQWIVRCNLPTTQYFKLQAISWEGWIRTAEYPSWKEAIYSDTMIKMKRKLAYHAVWTLLLTHSYLWVAPATILTKILHTIP